MTIREHVRMAIAYVKQHKKSPKEFLKLLRIHHNGYIITTQRGTLVVPLTTH